MEKAKKTAKASSKSKKLGSKVKNGILKAKNRSRMLLASGTTAAVRFGSVGENALIYLKEGVENQISELQESIATKEAAKKAALEALAEFEDLQSDCSMSDIRQRLNVTVSALVDMFNAM